MNYYRKLMEIPEVLQCLPINNNGYAHNTGPMPTGGFGMNMQPGSGLFPMGTSAPLAPPLSLQPPPPSLGMPHGGGDKIW